MINIIVIFVCLFFFLSIEVFLFKWFETFGFVHNIQIDINHCMPVFVCLFYCNEKWFSCENKNQICVCFVCVRVYVINIHHIPILFLKLCCECLLILFCNSYNHSLSPLVFPNLGHNLKFMKYVQMDMNLVTNISGCYAILFG